MASTNEHGTRISPDAGNQDACDCHGAWHAMQDHCVTWPCPGCPAICPPEPGTQEATARMQDWVAASGVFDDEES